MPISSTKFNTEDLSLASSVTSNDLIEIRKYDSLNDSYESQKVSAAQVGKTYHEGHGIEIDSNNNINATTVGNSTYSITPVKTGGVWIDNNDIFKKVINCGTLPNADTATIAHNISGLDKVIKWETIATNSTLYIDFNNLVESIDATNITITTTSDMSGYTGYVTIYYTLKKMFAKITPTEINRSLAQMNCSNDYKVELSNPNIDCYLGIFKWPISPNSNSIAILSRSTTNVTNALKLSEFDWSNLRGTIDVSLTSDYNGYKYASYLVSPILNQNFKNNYVDIQVEFSNLNECLNAFYS